MRIFLYFEVRCPAPFWLKKCKPYRHRFIIAKVIDKSLGARFFMAHCVLMCTHHSTSCIIRHANIHGTSGSIALKLQFVQKPQVLDRMVRNDSHLAWQGILAASRSVYPLLATKFIQLI